jgi:pantoate--beta-alanine ligase
MMVVAETIADTRKYLDRAKKEGKTVGFVPTMGALHAGHIELVKRSCLENQITGCSIFVNPIQFNNKEDLAKYPRTLEKDLELLEESGCDLIFVPSAMEMYPEPVSKTYDFGPLEKVMEGAYRPGHFNGVAIVVKKLFEIFTPDRSYFGEKDFQQLRIIQTLVEMERLPVEIIPCPTVREPDGLAMSSRNRRLTAEERSIAPGIYRALTRAKESMNTATVDEVKRSSVKYLEDMGFRVEYFESPNGAIACVAAFLGEVRLIDNMILFRIFAR